MPSYNLRFCTMSTNIYIHSPIFRNFYAFLINVDISSDAMLNNVKDILSLHSNLPYTSLIMPLLQSEAHTNRINY